MWRTRRERDRRRDREENTRWRGSLVYDTRWRGWQERGWGYTLVVRQRQGSDQVSKRTLVGLTCAPPSRRDTRQQRHRCCILSRYACYGRVVPSSSLPLPSTNRRRGAPWVHVRRWLRGWPYLCSRSRAGFPPAPSYGGGLIARRAKRGAYSRAFTGASRSGGVRHVLPLPPPSAVCSAADFS